jgi:glycolate oxidase iron-sulfur subunit
MSADILEAKMTDIEGTGASVICTANPGCTMQIQAGVRRRGLDAGVQHVIELLDESLELGRNPIGLGTIPAAPAEHAEAR